MEEVAALDELMKEKLQKINGHSNPAAAIAATAAASPAEDADDEAYFFQTYARQ